MVQRGLAAPAAEDIQQVARRKLRMLNSAKALQDLRVPPADRLEALKGDRRGQLTVSHQRSVADMFCVAGR